MVKLSMRRLRQHLRDLIALPSPSGRERAVACWCEDMLEPLGFEVEIDQADNLHARRGEPPFVLLNAHMDTVQDGKDVFQIEHGGLLIPRLDLDYGFDDKAGIAIILSLAEIDDLGFKVLLTVEEETGGNGIKNVEPESYDDVMCCLTLDRGGASDMVYNIMGLRLAPDDWLDAIDGTFRSGGFVFDRVTGRACDAFTIARHVPVVNLSVGVSERHTKYEYANVDQTMRTAKAIRWLLEHDGRLRELHGGRSCT